MEQWKLENKYMARNGITARWPRNSRLQRNARLQAGAQAQNPAQSLPIHDIQIQPIPETRGPKLPHHSSTPPLHSAACQSCLIVPNRAISHVPSTATTAFSTVQIVKNHAFPTKS